MIDAQRWSTIPVAPWRDTLDALHEAAATSAAWDGDALERPNGARQHG